MMQQFVGRTLLAPASAQWPLIDAEGIYETKIKSDSTGTYWAVASYVDAQNAFGALLRKHYAMLLHADRENKYWTPDDIQDENGTRYDSIVRLAKGE
jgi:hypothetical protein